MVRNPFDALPDTQREAAKSALRAAFGSAPIGAIAPLKGGASSASVFSVEADGRRYLLRIEGVASPLRNPHQYIAMRSAAEAEIAPGIHYIDEASRVAVIDFIEQQPLETYPGGPRALAQALGAMLARVQATPPFPRFVEYPDIVGRLWAHVCRTGLFAAGALDAHTEHLAQIREVYVWDSEKSVSSHNDPVPGNILFDGKRLWMIDWESAYRNDPLVDVAIMLDNLAPSPELEAVFLQAWLGRVADDSLRARLAMTRALTRLYYAGVLFSASAAAAWRTVPDADISAVTVSEFRQAIREGRLQPGRPETKHVLGKMFLASFISGVSPPGLAAAV
ncbi:MAG: phosphotransferase [Ferrovibrio sp.]|uniref:phosphotransferase n=1 Tax=Ferrovibrio sp. TaxID=1917215 RepID=UPI002625365C|nr:phosphotransferase [Ferrovibrio sp.]MCW0233589.1 phosphotransferase [Ferrovibrio sp.]